MNFCSMSLHVWVLEELSLKFTWPGQELGWWEHRPMHHKVVGSIPSQGTYLGCRFDPWSGIKPGC